MARLGILLTVAALCALLAGASAGGETIDDGQKPDDHAALTLDGKACYYSDFFDGRKTANGETFRQEGFSAAHRTLPLGTLVEVESLATGRKVKLRVNDRGPYSGGFAIDLSRGAARFLGVDRVSDRRVRIRVLSFPGDPTPPEPPVEAASVIPTSLLRTMLGNGGQACLLGTQ